MKVGFYQLRYDNLVTFRIGGTFVNYTSNDTQFHTPLYVSAWAYEAGENSFIWASIDFARMHIDDCTKIRRAVSEKCGVSFDNVLVSATHTHTGPTARDSVSKYFASGDISYLDKLNDFIIEACVKAWEGKAEAGMSYATCDETACVHNRRYLMEDGHSKMHPGFPGYPGRLMKEGPEDPQLQVIWFSQGEKPVGIIVNYSTHPSLMYGMRYTGGDFVGVMRRTLQAVYGDIPVLYLQGCCGNVCAIDHEFGTYWGKDRLEHAERAGKVLAGDILRIMNLPHEVSEHEEVKVAGKFIPLKYRKITEEDMRMADEVFDLMEKDRAAFDKLDVAVKAVANRTRKLADMRKEGDANIVPLSAIRIGDLKIMTNPAELFVEYQLEMKKLLGPKTLIAELTNGGICYVATKQGYLLRGYEVDGGYYDWEAGGILENEMLSLLKSL